MWTRFLFFCFVGCAQRVAQKTHPIIWGVFIFINARPCAHTQNILMGPRVIFPALKPRFHRWSRIFKLRKHRSEIAQMSSNTAKPNPVAAGESGLEIRDVPSSCLPDKNVASAATTSGDEDAGVGGDVALLIASRWGHDARGEPPYSPASDPTKSAGGPAAAMGEAPSFASNRSTAGSFDSSSVGMMTPPRVRVGGGGGEERDKEQEAATRYLLQTQPPAARCARGAWGRGGGCSRPNSHMLRWTAIPARGVLCAIPTIIHTPLQQARALD